jgi:hypothetical protein
MVKVMKKNPFEIKKSPCEIIAAQAIALDDYVKLSERGTGAGSCASSKGIIIEK